jgi:hypothetical protein
METGLWYIIQLELELWPIGAEQNARVRLKNCFVNALSVDIGSICAVQIVNVVRVLLLPNLCVSRRNDGSLFPINNKVIAGIAADTKNSATHQMPRPAMSAGKSNQARA